MIGTAGRKFRKLLSPGKPVPIVGTINAYCALQAEKIGHHTIYLSGAGVSNYSLGRPDDGSLTLDDVKTDVKRILNVTSLPLLVDVDTGFEDPENTVRELSGLGVAAMHMEDQVPAKLCGHLPGKQLVSIGEMEDRIAAALKGRNDKDFVIMARCDALAGEGFEGFIKRAKAYAEAGADMIFAEAMTDLDHYRQIKEIVRIPLLANMTEFGKTRLYTRTELGSAGVDMALYPLSAVRGMAKVAEEIYTVILENDNQETAHDLMQTRDDLYQTLSYDMAVENPAEMRKEPKK